MPIPPHRAPAKDGQTASRRARAKRIAPRCITLGNCTSTTCAARSRTAIIKAGTCTRRSFRRATRRSIHFSSKISNRRPQRMRNFVEKAAQATRIGQVFDDAAMAQGLLNYFLAGPSTAGALHSRRSREPHDAFGRRSPQRVLRENPRATHPVDAVLQMFRRTSRPGRLLEAPEPAVIFSRRGKQESSRCRASVSPEFDHACNFVCGNKRTGISVPGDG